MPVASWPTSPTASPKLSAICLPAPLMLSPVLSSLASNSLISLPSLIIVSGSLSPKKDISQANWACFKPSIMACIAPNTTFIEMVKLPPKTFCKASKPPVASFTALNISTKILAACAATPCTVFNTTAIESITSWLFLRPSNSTPKAETISPSPPMAKPFKDVNRPLTPILAKFLSAGNAPLTDFLNLPKAVTPFLGASFNSLPVFSAALPKSCTLSFTKSITEAALPLSISNSIFTFSAII